MVSALCKHRKWDQARAVSRYGMHRTSKRWILSLHTIIGPSALWHAVAAREKDPEVHKVQSCLILLWYSRIGMILRGIACSGLVVCY